MHVRGTRTWGRAAAVLLALTTAAVGMVGFTAPAQADNAPPPGTPATVSADALPTWQVNGVVWSQVLVGNTVYATGNFTKARPPGVGAGGAGEVNATNIFAFDVRTGNRVASFSHSLNGAGQYITKSPDGSRIYVGGDFTTVDGVVRGHIAAFNTSDGSLVSGFAPNVSARVSGITVSSDTVWVGGNFFNVNGSSRSRLAAVRASNGSLLPWAPSTDGTVSSLVLAPGDQQVVVGGQFNNLAGSPASGMGAVDAVTGAPRPWAANQRIRNGGDKSSIVRLRTDGTNVYGSGWAFGTGNFEGTFSATGAGGEINWLNDCHGDTYDAFPVGDVVYNVSHAHDCRWISDFPESDPWSVNMRHASAYTNYGTTTNIGPDNYGWDFSGIAAPEMLQWYPDLAIGSTTGQYQAAWAIAADERYVVMGGEFPQVNGVAQQGLVRFAVRDLAPNKRGPRAAPNYPAPSAFALGGDSVRVSWQSAYDMDNETLTYEVFRSGTAAPVYTATSKSNFWTYPMMGFRDSGLNPGVSYRYTVRITDPTGNILTLPQTAPVSVTAGGLGAYAEGVIDDGATAYWRLGESSGNAVYDWAQFNDANASSGVTRGADGAIGGSSDDASSFNGGGDGLVASNSVIATTPSFAVETWIKTSTTSGGKIVGYGGSSSGESGSYDRHVYMTNDGRIVFGVYPNAVRTLTSDAGFNDNKWHQVVGMLDATDGMSLWIDGKRVASDPGTRSAQDYAGYWRIGGDNLNSWPGQPSSNYFSGAIDDVAVYPASLSRAQVQRHYTDSGRTLDGPALPTDDYGKAVVEDEPALYWRLGDPAGSSSASDTSGNGDAGVISDGGIAFGTASGVAGTGNTAATFNGSTGTLGSTLAVNNPRSYSEELWFKTTTTQGGKLIGFGNAQSGTSSGYDRHVYMEDSGQVTFGVWTGFTNTTTSPASYNDGQWHHLAATQDSSGMRLYVDGGVVGTNSQTEAQDYAGYWRVGGDISWNGRTYFQGSIDEVAVYRHVLSGADVTRHFQAGGGQLANQLPAAAFDSTTTGLVASFDGTDSDDPDGTVESYAWAFGDGEQGTGPSPEHTYDEDGTYTVTLTVTDNRGGQDQVSHDVVVANLAPEAAFTQEVDGLVVNTDATGSTDPDGNVASYSWNFGDGTPASSGVTASHTYAAPGSYTVTLTVTDDAGAIDTATRTVVATSNQAPDAKFTASASGLSVDVNDAGSSDPDGNVASYSWNWGDSTATGSGATASHTYAVAGTYTVTLTVTDNQGATGNTTHDVVVSAPQFLARDAFGRTVSNGWGDAEVGGNWQRTGTATRFAVSEGAATISLAAASGPWMNLSGVSSSQTDVTVTVGLDKLPTGGPVSLLVRPRVNAAGENYHADARIQPNGSVAILLMRKVGTTDIVLSTVNTGLNYAPGERLMMRVQALGTGTTTVRAKVWKLGTTEPAAWQTSATDTAAALQVAGTIGLSAYLSGAATNVPVVVSFDDLAVRNGA